MVSDGFRCFVEVPSFVEARDGGCGAIMPVDACFLLCEFVSLCS